MAFNLNPDQFGTPYGEAYMKGREATKNLDLPPEAWDELEMSGTEPEWWDKYDDRLPFYDGDETDGEAQDGWNSGFAHGLDHMAEMRRAARSSGAMNEN